jgi:hypothetical protein
MNYAQLIDLYFDRSNALQWLWTLYVVIVGGLLAFSSLRQRPDAVTALLVLTLFSFFAYKNLGAIHEATSQRWATLHIIQRYEPAGGEQSPEFMQVKLFRDGVQGTFVPPIWESVRNFHITSDVVTILALLSMEWRRMRAKQNP